MVRKPHSSHVMNPTADVDKNFACLWSPWNVRERPPPPAFVQSLPCAGQRWTPGLAVAPDHGTYLKQSNDPSENNLSGNIMMNAESWNKHTCDFGFDICKSVESTKLKERMISVIWCDMTRRFMRYICTMSKEPIQKDHSNLRDHLKTFFFSSKKTYLSIVDWNMFAEKSQTHQTFH